MHSKLVGAAGFWPKLQAHGLSLVLQRVCDGPFVEPPQGARCSSRIVAYFLTWPAGGLGVLDEGRLDDPLLSGRRFFHQGDVPLAHQALLKLLGEVGLGGGIQRKDHESTGLDVQPVDTHWSIGLGNQLPQAKFGRVVGIFRTSRGRSHTPWFVNDHKVIFLVQDRELFDGRKEASHDSERTLGW